MDFNKCGLKKICIMQNALFKSALKRTYLLYWATLWA